MKAMISIDSGTIVSQDDDGVVRLSRRSQVTQQDHVMTLDVDYRKLTRWLLNRRNGLPHEMVQLAFPQLSADEREFILTGITQAEWNKYIKDDEDDDSDHDAH